MFAFSFGDFMKQYKFRWKIAVIICPIALVIPLYFAADFVSENITLPPCLIYNLFGIYCPGCGMTRSAEALLRGDIPLSIRQNAFIIAGIIICFLLYIGFVFKVFGKKPLFLLNNKKFIYTLVIISILYSVARNFIPAIAPI